MTSKEALKQYKKIYVDKTSNFRFCPTQEWYLDIIKQDLDKLENLEEENKVLLVNKNAAQSIAKKFKEENDKLKKVIEILKGMGIKLEHYPKSKNHTYILKIKAFGDDLFFDLVNEIRYNLLKEVLGNENK